MLQAAPGSGDELATPESAAPPSSSPAGWKPPSALRPTRILKPPHKRPGHPTKLPDRAAAHAQASSSNSRHSQAAQQQQQQPRPVLGFSTPQQQQQRPNAGSHGPSWVPRTGPGSAEQMQAALAQLSLQHYQPPPPPPPWPPSAEKASSSLPSISELQPAGSGTAAAGQPAPSGSLLTPGGGLSAESSSDVEGADSALTPEAARVAAEWSVSPLVGQQLDMSCLCVRLYLAGSVVPFRYAPWKADIGRASMLRLCACAQIRRREHLHRLADIERKAADLHSTNASVLGRAARDAYDQGAPAACRAAV